MRTTKIQRLAETLRTNARQSVPGAKYSLNVHKNEIWVQSAHCTVGAVYAAAKKAVADLGFKARYYPPIRVSGFRSYSAFTVFLKRA